MSFGALALHETPQPALADWDRTFMQTAIALSRRGLGLSSPNPSVGAIIVRFDGETPLVVGRGVTAPGGRPHAERIALDQAGALANGATIYVTLEPCARRSVSRDGPSCTDAVLCSGIRRVVIGANDPSPFAAGEGARRLSDHGIAVTAGICADAAHGVNFGHALRVTKGRPLVTLKLAQTADGFAADNDGRPLKITGSLANARTHLMRARSDAIAVGVGTVLADDPLLTCRLPGLESRSPIRIIFDSMLRTPVDARLVGTAKKVPTWFIAGMEAPITAERQLTMAGAEIMRVPAESAGRGLDIAFALRLIADRGITRLMLEGGPSLADAFARCGLIDEAVLLTSEASAETGKYAIGPQLAKYFHQCRANGRVETEMLGQDTMQTFSSRELTSCSRD